MSEYIASTINHKGLTIKIIQDSDASSPRDDDNAGTMVCWHRRYTLGDEQRTDDPSEWMDGLAEEVKPGILDWLDHGFFNRIVTANVNSTAEATLFNAQVADYRCKRAARIQAVLDANYIMLPLRLLDHSGISMSIGRGAHPQDPGGWDSGQVGWIYCTKKKAVEEWGKKLCTNKVVKQAEACLRCEVEVYDQFLTGEVFGYVIEDEDGKGLDSLWGMFGFDYCKSEALEEAERQIHSAAKDAAESAGDIPMVCRK